MLSPSRTPLLRYCLPPHEISLCPRFAADPCPGCPAPGGNAFPGGGARGWNMFHRRRGPHSALQNHRRWSHDSGMSVVDVSCIVNFHPCFVGNFTLWQCSKFRTSFQSDEILKKTNHLDSLNFILDHRWGYTVPLSSERSLSISVDGQISPGGTIERKYGMPMTSMCVWLLSGEFDDAFLS